MVQGWMPPINALPNDRELVRNSLPPTGVSRRKRFSSVIVQFDLRGLLVSSRGGPTFARLNFGRIKMIRPQFGFSQSVRPAAFAFRSKVMSRRADPIGGHRMAHAVRPAPFVGSAALGGACDSCKTDCYSDSDKQSSSHNASHLA
jgi:hypothetical protein